MVRPPTRHLGDYYDVMPGTDDNGSPYDVKKSYCMTVGIVTTAIVFTIGCAVLCNYMWRQYFGHDSHRPPPKGLRKNVIKNLPKQVFKSKRDSEGGGGGGDNNEELADCAICLTGFVDGDEIRVLPQCRHGFHVTCIDTWLGNHSSCPSCRQIVIVKCRRCNKFCDEANNQNQNQNQNQTQNANTNVNPSSADLEAGSSVAREGDGEGGAVEGEDSNKAV